MWSRPRGIPPKKNTEKKTQWKNRLRSHAQRLFPDYKIIIQVADSVLIAEYGRRKMNGILLPTVSGGKEKKGVADGD